MNSNSTEALNKKFVIVPTALGRFQRPTILALSVIYIGEIYEQG